jgi:hypothetical protein
VQAVDGPLRRGPWRWLHHPRPVPGAYVLAGHLHPGVVLGGRGARPAAPALLPLRAAVGVLPAFGAFTGMHVMPPRPGDRVFVVRASGAPLPAVLPKSPGSRALPACPLRIPAARAESCWRAWKRCCRMRPAAPDWAASVAFRYRKRGGAGVLEPVRHVATIRLADLKEVDAQKERLLRNTEQFVAGRRPTTCC